MSSTRANFALSSAAPGGVFALPNESLPRFGVRVESIEIDLTPRRANPSVNRRGLAIDIRAET